MPDTAHNVSPNVRCSRYFIVESRIQCDQCNVVTAVFGFALPADYESLYIDDDASDDESGTWESQGIAAVLFNVEYLPWSPFGSMPSEGLEAIRLHAVREPFAAWVGGESHDVKPLDS
jgi:hypothetical protein